MMRKPPPADLGERAFCRLQTAGSDIQIAHELRILLDEEPTGLDLVAHERLEDLISQNRVLHTHSTDRARIRIHRGLPQLIRVHLAKTLVALRVHRATAVAVTESRGDVIALADVVRVVLLFPLGDAEERR